MNKRSFLQIFICCAVVFAIGFGAIVAQAEERIPRAASLKRTVTNVRAGPGKQYPILWVFKRKGWPVEIIARHQGWYQIRDVEGEEGWVYATLVSGQQTAVTRNKKSTLTTLFRRPDGAKPILKFEDGVVLGIETCSPYMCKVRYRNYKGWVMKDTILLPESATFRE